MFGKLKEKLKSALSSFSRKAEAHATEETPLPTPEELIAQTKARFGKESAELPGEEKHTLEEDQKMPTVQEILDSVDDTDGDGVDNEIDDRGIKKREKTPKAEKEHGQGKADAAGGYEEQKSAGEGVEDGAAEKRVKEEAPPWRVPKETPPVEAAEGRVSEEKPGGEARTERPDRVEPKKSLFGKLKEKLTTKTISGEKFDELFWELEVMLLESNVSVEVIQKIKNDLKLELVNRPLPRDVPGTIEKTLRQTLGEVLSFDAPDLLKIAERKKPFVIAFFGINGTGKTTTIAKLAAFFQKNDRSVVLAACDTFRAAAIQQLEEHANRLNVKMIKHEYGSDAAAVAYDAVKYAEKNNVDVVMIDTAGRLHSNTNLMDELAKIIRVARPDMKIFVGESITGNDCIEQARRFDELVEVDGAILTKADVDEKGGAPLSIAYTIKKPILFLGTGQGYDDLERFDKHVIVQRLGL